MFQKRKEEVTPRDVVKEIVRKIIPYDDLESQHIQETLTWIQSGTPIFRIRKPDVPPKHLVSYFILFDEKRNKVLLVDHKKAQLWLPAGGHVEIDEHPQDTVERECFEELGIKAEFWREEFLFLTSSITNGEKDKHIDVSLWYVIKGQENSHYHFDTREFRSIKWFSFDEIPYERSDPHMSRFIEKLKNRLYFSI